MVSLILFIITIALYINVYKKNKNYRETEGVIIDINEQSRPGEIYPVIIPTISYVVDGKEYKRVGGYKNNMKIGDKIKVLYDIKNPQKSATRLGTYLPPIILTVLIILLLIVEIILSALS